MTAKRYFIVGGSGLIGRALYSEAKKRESFLSVLCELLTVRLDDFNSIENINFNEGDVIFLLAAISSPDICKNEYERARNVNVHGTSSLIQKIIDCKARVIFFSSDTVYGEIEKEFDETAPANPIGEYAVMKHEVEQLFEGNPLFKSIRLSYVFSREDKFSSLLARYAERQEAVDIFHPFLRAIVHRNDVIKGVLAIAERWDEIPEQIINFGGPKILSRVNIAEYLREIVFTNVQLNVVEPDIDFFKSRPRVIAMSSPIFCRILGRSPKTFYEATKLEFNILT